MPVCSQCGAAHEVLDPTFVRPDAYVALDPAQQEAHATADDDLCCIEVVGARPRFFVRGVMPVEVADLPEGVSWGVWAEVDRATFTRILELWSADDQAATPPFDGELANDIPSYPATIGLKLAVQLTGPSTRPRFRFRERTDHPFVVECESGVTLHRAQGWNALRST